MSNLTSIEEARRRVEDDSLPSEIHVDDERVRERHLALSEGRV